MSSTEDNRNQPDLANVPTLEAGTFGDCVEGTVERIVYENADNGFIVARLREPAKTELTTIVGSLLAVSPGESVRLWGRWIEDKKFGRQLRVEKMETLRPATVEAIEKYLGSGLIRGVGPAFAKRLVKAFGGDTLRVLDETPEKLTRVAGIGPAKAAQIRESWQQQRTVRSIMLFMQGHDIGIAQAVRIYKEYGDKALAILRENPYRLAEDIVGIAFKSADDIARKLGKSIDDPHRLMAGLLYTLRDAGFDGHVYLPRPELVDRAKSLLQCNPALLDGPLAELEQRGSIIREGDACFNAPAHVAETGCERYLKKLLSTPHEPIPIDVPRAIQWVEQQKSITLAPEQREAIQTVCQSKVSIITGGPGTGKTTVLNSVIAILEKKGIEILLAAPTGRAAKRMSEATGHESRTIHRLLEFNPKFGGFTRNENNPLSAGLVIIDECSMIDVFLMHSLLKAIQPKARLLMVGDVDQLPSVGPGNVLLDVIASNAIPVVWLKTVFRQAAESGIITNAHRINQGQYPVFNDRDFFFVERKDPARAMETIVELVTKRIPAKFELDPVKDIQVLSPMHRGEVGVSKLNEVLQAKLNSGAPTNTGPRGIRLSDKVMQTRNNYDLETFNGDIGIVTVLDADAQEAHVQYDDRTVLYDFEQLEDVSLAYAVTVHKSQGSEYPAVVIPLLTQHYMMLSRNVLYTGLTRASKLVVLVGDPKALRIAIGNTKVTQRFTRLADRLRNTI